MFSVKEYLLTVIAAAIICGTLIKLVDSKTAHGKMIHLLTGLFLSITVISPIAKVNIQNLSSYLSALQVDASEIVEEAEDVISQEKQQFIKQAMESYIGDEADELALSLDISVRFADDHTLNPCAVIIQGPVSPYKKKKLQNIISNDLGIPEENQTWI